MSTNVHHNGYTFNGGSPFSLPPPDQYCQPFPASKSIIPTRCQNALCTGQNDPSKGQNTPTYEALKQTPKKRKKSDLAPKRSNRRVNSDNRPIWEYWQPIKKASINLDWLHVTGWVGGRPKNGNSRAGRLSPDMVPPWEWPRSIKMEINGLTFVPDQSPTKPFKRKYAIYHHREPDQIAELECDPLRGHRNMIGVRLLNYTLYRPGYIALLESILKALGVPDVTIGQDVVLRQIHIAADATGLDQLVHVIHSRRVEKVGRVAQPVTKVAPIHLVHGSRQSNSYLVIYEKGKQLTKAHKPYIEAAARRAGVLVPGQPRADLYRMEVRIKNKDAKLLQLPDQYGELAPIQLKDLENNRVLVGILEARLTGWFEWRLPEPGKRKSDWDRLKIFDYQALGAAPVVRQRKGVRKSNEVYLSKLTTSKLTKDAHPGHYLPDQLQQATAQALQSEALPVLELVRQALGPCAQDHSLEALREALKPLYGHFCKYVAHQIPHTICDLMAAEHGTSDYLARKRYDLARTPQMSVPPKPMSL